ncbi:hypothetical protein Pan216_31410 [Planctomycetes bacterium Pan216]|uniref:PsbP C-terminal domain-containing protein n=1 Tax=Kolteria novifilia TaxID=2527975 RepID=A0A518B5M5_9BACT|nr:hypothetical protein Pan216_31410 [Planctomycetes bacterium Pan216]
MRRTLTSAATLLMTLTVGLATAQAADEKYEQVRIGPATYDISSTWTRQNPKSRMRLVQYGLPAAKGDEGKKAELVVFYFGPGGGGSVADNLERWKGQFSSTEGQPKEETFKVGDFKVTTLDITGTFKDKPAPFLPDFVERKGYRMLVAIVDTPEEGAYYFKITGPKATVGAQYDNWMKMLKSVKPAGS